MEVLTCTLYVWSCACGRVCVRACVRVRACACVNVSRPTHHHSGARLPIDRFYPGGSTNRTRDSVRGHPLLSASSR
jgi:hypothetical protein